MIVPITLMDEFHVHLAMKIESDVTEFMKDTNEEDELQIILRAHLYIEHEIEKMLRHHLFDPSVILDGRNKLNFNTKLKLLVALGLIPKNKKSSYDQLGALRNKYAHTLKYKMTEKDLNSLVDSMDSEIKGEIFYREWNEDKPMADEKRHLLKVKRSMLTLWIYVAHLVYDMVGKRYVERIEEVEARYMGPDNTQSLEECEAECMEYFNEMKEELGMTEEFLDEMKRKLEIAEHDTPGIKIPID